MAKRINIKDVAKEAGVSVTTTSYALNNVESARISQETIQRVRAAAVKLNYVPSLSARTMINRRSGLIGVIIPQTGSSNQLMFNNPFYGEFLGALEYVIRESGYHLLISGTGPNQDYTSIARMRQLEGIIILGTYPCEFLNDIKRIGIPVVLVDAYVNDPYFHSVSINDRYGGYIATKHLIDMGHRNIAFLSEKIREQGVHEQRLWGYKDALEEADIPFSEKKLYVGDVSYNGGFSAAKEICKQHQQETAVFVTADVMAMGLVNGMTTMGKSIPEDYSIIGFDDVPLSAMCLPMLTTIHQNIAEKGSMSAKALLNAIKGCAKQDIILPLHVVKRQSVADINEGGKG